MYLARYSSYILLHVTVSVALPDKGFRSISASDWRGTIKSLHSRWHELAGGSGFPSNINKEERRNESEEMEACQCHIAWDRIKEE
jgi:hypothetical protein